VLSATQMDWHVGVLDMLPLQLLCFFFQGTRGDLMGGFVA